MNNSTVIHNLYMIQSWFSKSHHLLKPHLKFQKTTQRCDKLRTIKTNKQTNEKQYGTIVSTIQEVKLGKEFIQKRTGSRFSACSIIKMLFFCWDMRLCKQYDQVIMLSKNHAICTLLWQSLALDQLKYLQIAVN